MQTDAYLRLREAFNRGLEGDERDDREDEGGQGMVEYGLIIAAVAIAVIVALFALGPKIGSMFSSTAAQVSMLFIGLAS